jgi:Transposase zinc-binding domain
MRKTSALATLRSTSRPHRERRHRDRGVAPLPARVPKLQSAALPAATARHLGDHSLPHPGIGRRSFACERCGQVHFAFHSCNHKACPQCGREATARWIDRELGKLVARPTSWSLLRSQANCAGASSARSPKRPTTCSLPRARRRSPRNLLPPRDCGRTSAALPPYSIPGTSAWSFIRIRTSISWFRGPALMFAARLCASAKPITSCVCLTCRRRSSAHAPAL